MTHAGLLLLVANLLVSLMLYGWAVDSKRQLFAVEVNTKSLLLLAGANCR